MSKLPEPDPAKIRAAGVAVRTLEKGTSLWRIHFRAGAHPTRWDELRRYGPLATARFDHHLDPPRLQRRAILYAAADGPTCLAEVFQATRTIDRGAREPWLVSFDLARDVKLLDLTGAWPTRAGASMALSVGRRDRARRWSQAIYAAVKEVEGLFYPSSMWKNKPCVALYERARSALPRDPTLQAALSDRMLDVTLENAANDLGYVLI